MNSKINLSNIKRCSQDWDKMTDCGAGRHCAKCKETIFDFRGLSEWEIVLKHSNSKSKVCGIYEEHQLNNTRLSDKFSKSKKGLFLAGIFGFLASSSSFGQSNQAIKSKQEITPMQAYSTEKIKLSARTSNKIDSLKSVSGILKDSQNRPIIGGAVVVKGTEKGVITDVYGKFELDVTEEVIERDSFILSFNYFGYGKKEMILSKTAFIDKNEIELNIIMEEQGIEMEFFAVRRAPLHKRIWYRIKNIFK